MSCMINGHAGASYFKPPIAILTIEGVEYKAEYSPEEDAVIISKSRNNNILTEYRTKRCFFDKTRKDFCLIHPWEGTRNHPINDFLKTEGISEKEWWRIQ